MYYYQGDGHRRCDDDPAAVRRAMGEGRRRGCHLQQTPGRPLLQGPPAHGISALHFPAHREEPRAFPGRVWDRLPPTAGVRAKTRLPASSSFLTLCTRQVGMYATNHLPLSRETLLCARSEPLSESGTPCQWARDSWYCDGPSVAVSFVWKLKVATMLLLLPSGWRVPRHGFVGRLCTA